MIGNQYHTMLIVKQKRGLAGLCIRQDLGEWAEVGSVEVVTALRGENHGKGKEAEERAPPTTTAPEDDEEEEEEEEMCIRVALGQTENQR